MWNNRILYLFCQRRCKAVVIIIFLGDATIEIDFEFIEYLYETLGKFSKESFCW